MKTIYVDRSRIEQWQRCPRSRWLAYHQDGLGITGKNKPLPLAVGGAVHKGLESLLLGGTEDAAVAAAIADLAEYRGALEVDTTELAAQSTIAAVPADEMRIQLAASLGLSVEDAGLDALMTTQASGKDQFERWLWEEQCSLVEGMVRAYARRRLRPLLEEYEVLEVEREGEWELSTIYVESGTCHCGQAMEGHSQYDNHSPLDNPMPVPIVFMSRPDALLRSRSDNSLYLLSYKTAASWDIRKSRDAEHDMQGLSEGVEVERRLGEWWDRIRHETPPFAWQSDPKLTGCTEAIFQYLCSIPAPPRILGIRYEYMLKGDRWKDKDLSAKVGFDARSQRSHLIRCYENKKDPSQINAMWDFVKDDGSASNLAWQTWKSRPVWECMSIKAWIDLLDSSEEAMSGYDSTVGIEPRSLGWKSAAQVTGYLSQHPLDSIFIPPIIIYRNDDDLRDWLEQTEEQERRIAEGVAEVEAAMDEDSRRSKLNVHFGQTRRACSYPTECNFTKICYGSQDIRKNPLDSGLYVRRSVNHPQELQNSVKDAK